MSNIDRIAIIGSSTTISKRLFGERAERLHLLSSHDFPVPMSVAISTEEVKRLNSGHTESLKQALNKFNKNDLLAVRPSQQQRFWNGIQASFNVGISHQSRDRIANIVGSNIANTIYADFLHTYAIDVAAIPVHLISFVEDQAVNPLERVEKLLSLINVETGEEFPQDRLTQLIQVCRAMIKKWETSYIAPVNRAITDKTRLGLIIQVMADGHRCDGSCSGKMSSINWDTGAPQESGHLTIYQDGRPLYGGGVNPVEEYLPNQANNISQLLQDLRYQFKDPQQIEFAFDGCKLWLIEASVAERSISGAIRIAVELVNDGLISRAKALQHVSPDSLGRVLHPQVKPNTDNQVVARGIPASPGAAVGRIALSSQTAEKFVAAGEDCILMRAETGPEDFRGMHTAQGVLTGRGGLTSHAAVVARGLGVPCVVGASDIQILPSKSNAAKSDRILRTKTGKILKEGDYITVDGTTGTVLEGQADLIEPALNQYFESFLTWADEVRDIGVKANADTIDEVKVAKKFKSDGIGLCRTEHMYFEESQLAVMRQMLFVESSEERKIVLRQLIQMQQRDFSQIFRQMPGKTVCIRLFDPPLHEFLPRSHQEMQRFADELGCEVKHVEQRADELKEFNPMLGMRGVRVGIVMPEVYEMQARAIFQAVIEVYREGLEVIPEIMIPLVSANKELELVQCHVDKVALSVKDQSNINFQYRLGVMVETPRAALRAGDLAKNSDFLSFGTNDMTQMTYGLSRDDSQRFMENYIQQGVYPSDPFGTLDIEGVGELLKIAAARAKEVKENLTLSICGEHGGDPDSIEFCRNIGFNYVSCSPYRVPIARLAAAQCALLSPPKSKSN